MTPIAPPRNAAELLAIFHALPRREQIAFLAALIRAGLLPSLRIVRPWQISGEAPNPEPPLAV